jgi:hypothetical protein
MSNTLREVEQIVTKLSEAELHEFEVWFANLRDQQWERQIEQDSLSGRLDSPVNAARRSHENGLSREI